MLTGIGCQQSARRAAASSGQSIFNIESPLTSRESLQTVAPWWKTPNRTPFCITWPASGNQILLRIALWIARVEMILKSLLDSNTASTLRFPVIANLQLAVPLQSPPQRVNVAPEADLATSVTLEPLLKLCLQSGPQLIPAGVEVIVPRPLPLLTTVSENPRLGTSLKVAVTVRASVIVTVQLAVPLQAPLQPLKLDALSGTAVSVTLLPEAKFCAQSLPQLMPAGEELTVPVPLPLLLTESR